MSTKTIVLLVVGAIGALGVWKMVDDLLVFRQTVESRFAQPSAALARQSNAPNRRSPRRISQEAQLPLGEMASASLVGIPVYGEPPATTLSLEADIDRGPARSKAHAATDKYVAEHRAQWGIREYHELRGEEYPGPMGTEVRYKVYQDGLEVMGLELRLEVDGSGNVSETANNYLPMGRVDLTQPELAPEEALRRSGIVPEGDVAAAAMTVRRVLWAGSGSDEPELGWSVSLINTDGTGLSSAVLNAADGRPLARNYSRR